MEKIKELMVKTYAVDNASEVVFSIHYGRANTLEVRFTNGTKTQMGNIPATYICQDPMKQAIIENSDLYKKGAIYLLRQNESGKTYAVHDATGDDAKPAKESKPQTTQGKKKDVIPSHEAVNTDGVNPAPDVNHLTGDADGGAQPNEPSPEDDGIPVSNDKNGEQTDANALPFADVAEAQDYLCDNYDVKRSDIRSKKAVLEFAKSKGLSIVIGE